MRVSSWSSCWMFYGLSRLCVERGFQTAGEVGGSALAPVVQKKRARRFARHVMMDGDDVDAGFAQRLQHRLQFVFVNREVAVNYGAFVRAGERGPGVHAHLLADFAAASHCRVAP